MSQAISEIADADHAQARFALLLRDLSVGNLGTLAARLAGSVSELDPATRLLIAQRVVAYTSDLLIRPFSGTGRRILDDANSKLAWMAKSRSRAPANDQ